MSNEPALPAPREQPPESALQDSLATLHASRVLMAGIAGGVLVAGVLYAKLASPVYRADVLIQVEDRKPGIAGLDDLTSLITEQNASDTEIEILRSRSLVDGVVRKLALDVEARPRLFPLIGGAVWRAHTAGDLAGAPVGLSRFAWGGERIKVDRFHVPPELEDEDFRLIAGPDDGYVLLAPGGEEVLQGKAGAAAGGEGAIRLFVSELRARPGTHFTLVKRPSLDAVHELQKALAIGERGKKTGIIRIELGGTDREGVVRTLEELAAAYVRQNVERKSAEAEKTLQFVSSQLPELKARVEQAERVLNDYQSRRGTVDLTLQAKAAIDRAVNVEKVATELQMQRAELAQRFMPAHPALAALDRKMAEVNAERSRSNAVIKDLPDAELGAARLMRDVKVTNELYVLLLNKSQELQVAKSGTVGNVRILDHAVLPARPAYPRLAQALPIALLLGLALAVLAAFARRALSRGVEDPDALESATGLGVYASIPHSERQAQLGRAQSRGRDGVGVLAKRYPAELAVESLRSLRTSLQFALMDAPNRIIALGGPGPGTGKSFVAANLAQVLADSGRRVLLVDADMRKGTLHAIFGVAAAPGLSDTIAGAVAFEDAVHRGISENLDLLTQGVIPPNPSELLMSRQFRELLDRLSAEYELLVVDTPPVLAVTDSAIVAGAAGVTLVVLRAGQHPLREVTQSLKRFAQTGVRPAGIVLNDVARRARKGSYAYSYHYEYESGNGKVRAESRH